jgi:signal transduction histidine kinase
MNSIAAARFARPAWLFSWPFASRRRHWSLADQYLLASLVVVLVGVLITSIWLGARIESGVLDRTAGITALYVDSVVNPNLQGLASDDASLAPTDTAALDRLVSESGGLGQGVVLFKIWSLDGRVLYSPDSALVGQSFPIDSGLQRAAQGEVVADMSNLDEPENVRERERFSRLVQVYAPVREENDGTVVAVNEFYLLPNALDAEIRGAQLSSWALVAGIGVVTYVLLAGIVKRGSDTIERQQRELQRRLDQNVRLHQRVLQAAGRTTTLNEQALRRISADLHDGPGQALALALLRLDSLRAPNPDATAADQRQADFATVRDAVRDALAEVRAISAGLRLPELEPLSVPAVVSRAIDDHQRRSGVAVSRHLENVPDQAPLSIKIALLRTLQEALSNATRHGQGKNVAVDLRSEADTLSLTVADRGPGFDPRLAEGSGGLGLAGMHERAELLGGKFHVDSAPGRGTTLRVFWPLATRADA